MNQPEHSLPASTGLTLQNRGDAFQTYVFDLLQYTEIVLTSRSRDVWLRLTISIPHDGVVPSGTAPFVVFDGTRHDYGMVSTYPLAEWHGELRDGRAGCRSSKTAMTWARWSAPSG